MKTHSTVLEPGANGQSSGSTSAMLAASDGTQSRVSREFHNFVADIEDLITKTTSLTGEDLARAKANLSERVAAAKESMNEMSGAIVQRTRRAAAVTNNYVHEQPWQAVGISAAVGATVGVLLGFVLARRK